MHTGGVTLAIVVPCHNEQEVLETSAAVLLARIESLVHQGLAASSSYLCLVDDGSTDRTWELIRTLNAADPRIHGLKLARNFGHQGAVLAGLMECTADVAITIDADLQDDDACITEMLRKHREGFDIVLGVRDDRSSDSIFKRATAQAYYRLLRSFGVRLVYNHADYRLLSGRAIAELRQYQETNLFLRGIVPLLGYRSAIVGYARKARFAGESKYPLRKMLALAWQGITSFSVTPLRMVSGLGLIFALGSMGVSIWALVVKLLGSAAVPGWASTVIPMYFLGGVQILCLGVIGEYIGKIYLETKRRPRYAIDAHIGARQPDAPLVRQPLEEARCAVPEQR
jgi:glycosyltransferase involved in cell wall biosynthesis